MSKSNSSSSSSAGCFSGFSGMLTILFVGLKLTHYIDWSWWWVLSPLWISFILGVIVFLVVVVVYAIFK